MLAIDPKHPISPIHHWRGKKAPTRVLLWLSAAVASLCGWVEVGYLSEEWHLPNILPPGGVKQEHTPSSCDRELNIHLSAKTPACIPVSTQKLDCVARLCGRIGF